MSEELVVAIIGAASALIGAIFSTVSIILSNKNSKHIKQLDLSNDVRKEIATKRYDIYTEIIEYINSWYHITTKHDFDYSSCGAKNHLEIALGKYRINSLDELKAEIEAVKKISLYYFYLDGKTYKLLKYLEGYLFNVLICITTRKIQNQNFFFYVIYTDLWTYVFALSKQVNKYIKRANTLNFTPSKKLVEKKAKAFYEKTNFYKIYDIGMVMENYESSFKKQAEPLVAERNEQLAHLRSLLNDKVDVQTKIKILVLIKNIQHDIKKINSLSYIRTSKKVKKCKLYTMKTICDKCSNTKCLLHKEYCEI